MQAMMEKLLTPADVADFLQVKPKAVERMAREGKLPMMKVGYRWRILPSELRKWYDSRTKTDSGSKSEE